jgi:hypothetical protein
LRAFYGAALGIAYLQQVQSDRKKKSSAYSHSYSGVPKVMTVIILASDALAASRIVVTRPHKFEPF